MKMRAFPLLIGLLLVSSMAYADTGKDFIFTRMQGFTIIEQKNKEYESVAIWTKKSENNDYEEKDVEGAYVETKYNFEGAGQSPSILQVIRAHENAVRGLGGSILYKSAEYRCLYATFKKNEREYYVALNVYNDGATYVLTLVEPGELASKVAILEADAIISELEEKGQIRLYIHFDVGKALIKPESQPVVDEVVKALRAKPDMKVSVEGHTDAAGGAQANQKLSEERAEAVRSALAAAGIGKERLSSRGFGQNMPLASNDTEEGRAKNRRVELVRR